MRRLLVDESGTPVPLFEGEVRFSLVVPQHFFILALTILFILALTILPCPTLRWSSLGEQAL